MQANSSIIAAFKNESYDDMQKAITKSYVAPEYHSEFSKITSIKYIQERLKSVPNDSFFYKSEKGKYIELKIARADKKLKGIPRHVILGLADRDTDFVEKLAQKTAAGTGSATGK